MVASILFSAAVFVSWDKHSFFFIDLDLKCIYHDVCFLFCFCLFLCVLAAASTQEEEEGEEGGESAKKNGRGGAMIIKPLTDLVHIPDVSS